MTSLFASAQNPETIETFAVNYHETEWYGEQAQAWQKVVDANPQDQWAWRNLFRATYYYDQFTNGLVPNPDESQTANVIRRMEETLPESFVLNLCKCIFCLTTDQQARMGECVRRAVELMPEDVCAEDVSYLAMQLWRIAPESGRLKELNTTTHHRNYYPEHILRFNWNILHSLEHDAIFISNGYDMTQPMKVLQDAIGERTDVCVIPLSFLHDEHFRTSLFERLGIKPIEGNPGDKTKAGYKQFSTDVIMHIIRESGRPTYFFPDILSFTTLDKDSLYNEGLVLKYSDHPYNNFAVAMHNVKEVYHLEYLTEPDIMYSAWENSTKMDVYHVTLLGNLISKLRKNGEETEAKRLHDILKGCVEQDKRDGPEYKEFLMSKLKEE